MSQCFIKVKQSTLDKLSEDELCLVDDAIWDCTTKHDGYILDTSKLSIDIELKLLVIEAEAKAIKKLDLPEGYRE